MYVYVYVMYIYIHIYNYCKIKRGNHQVPKTVRVPENKTNPKKIKYKFTNNAITTAINTNKYRIY